MLVFRLLLLLSVTSLPLVYSEDPTTSVSTDLPVLLTAAPHQHDTVADASTESQRQGRKSLQAELPAAKAKREQALRNILAAKRRQVLGQRASLVAPRSRGDVTKDMTDVLEVQESRHGIYFAVPTGVKDVSVEGDVPEPLTVTLAKTASEDRIGSVERIEDATSKSPEPIKRTTAMKDLGYDERSAATVATEIRQKLSPGGISRSGYPSASRNSSVNVQRATAPKNTAINDSDGRKNNNTVIMSDSLYKHFRPVESNVPIEEMTQFLHFGQKLSPETQNTTSSNSLEVTPTLPPVPSSRRRFSMKRYSTTTPVPVPRLEEIINEEMNIAVERQTVERNKIPKIKNLFRSPSASSLYYRKSPVRPADPTIVSNVISQPTTKNISEGDVTSKRENDSRYEELHQPLNPSSSHASRRHQVQRGVAPIEENEDQGKGSATSHDSVASGYADVGATQLSNETNNRGSQLPRNTNETRSTDATETKPVSSEETRGSINGHSSGYPMSSSNVTTQDARANNLDDRVPVSSTDSPGRETSTTLRIVVAETPAKDEEDPANPSSYPGGSPPVVVLPAQQHVYTYTITNVTRLLRNYSGPGVSSKEEGEQKRQQYPGPAPAGTAEISDDSSSGIVATRSRSDLSAGPAAEGVTTLEGKQVNRSSGDYDPRSDADAASRAATSTRRTPLEVNKTATKVADSEVGGSVPADAVFRTVGTHDSSANFTYRTNLREDLRDADQRMLQKSASAVLNQRPGDELLIGDRTAGKGSRRRDQPRGHPFGADDRAPKDHRKTIQVGSKVGDDSTLRQFASRGERNEASEVPSSTWKSSDESVQSTRPTDNVSKNRNTSRNTGDRQVLNRKRNFEESSEKETLDVLADRSLRKYSDMTNHHSIPDTQIRGTTMTPLEITTIEENNRKSDASKIADGKNGPDDFREGHLRRNKVETSVGRLNASDNGASAGTGDTDRKIVGADPPIDKSGIAERKFESATSSTKETVTSDGTTAPSLFPVTPRILSSVEILADKEANAVTVEESVTDVPTIRATNNITEAERPFGIAEDLSPSEIQQMYRPSNTARPDLTTTLNPELQVPPQQSQGEGKGEEEEGEEEGAPRVPDERFNGTRQLDENWNGQRPVSVERSPEVRGRNLSDKTRDKDDILPIMHLYNTTSIFNETSSPLATSPSSHGAETRHSVLPVDEKNLRTNEDALDSVTTALPTVGSLVPDPSKNVEKNKIFEPPSLPDYPAVQRLPDSALTKPADNSTRHKEDHGSREPAEPSYSNKGNNFTSGANTSRPRHKHNHQSSTAKFNTSVFEPALNRTYFEPGSSSPSVKDTVNISEVIKRYEGDAIASQETVAVVSYILATLVVFPIALGVGLILRRLIIKNRKMLEESDTSSEISCRKDALNLENGDFKTSIEKAITKLPRIQHLCHEAEKSPLPPAQESRWEFPRDKLRLQTVLGQGNFGQVWKAEADDLTGHQGTTRLVAVKTVKEGASSREKEDLVRELEIMQQLGNHPNVVTLLGCCTEEEPHYLILEYVMYGKLLAYLRDHRTRQDFYNFSEDSAALTSRDLTVFGYCVARGMEYLASKKIIHRDLAARNVLVDHNKLCKIADFGMSRFANEDGEVIETRHGRNALPIRWMAPESLIYSLFTTKTDVWSFGILMWEIVTLGSTPYPDMTAREVMRNVQSGYRLERPSHCRSELFRVISRCWQADPDRRPEFQVLRRDLAQLLEDNMNGHYVDLESFASECTD
ncbi:uncharacterized protein LOC105689572 isoform X1 [Athalia rosae]|uniref:uncharacterized protein LOC105689572 isoform X1 n=1 Tax=Athalia rosae TaxID=37344 RepID=UPI0020332BB3|nr:uncharacterized protein LOC105689572 isoform X1 [Athalia rosae]